MILVRPSFELWNIDPSSHTMKRLEAAGRVCYKSEGNITNESADKFVGKLISSGHESVLEHEKITVKVVCDRGVTHEIVRHRLASYSQESTRYCDYAGGVTFVIPPWSKIDTGVYTMWPRALGEDHSQGDWHWVRAMDVAEVLYTTMRSEGWSPQQARSVLPNSLKTEIVMTMNLREWRHFFKLRCSPKAHPQMREIAQMMADEFASLLPVVFGEFSSTKNDELTDGGGI